MSDVQPQYRVVRGPVQIRRTRAQDVTEALRAGPGHFYAGEILPEGVDPGQIRHLLSIGMVEPITGPAPAETDA